MRPALFMIALATASTATAEPIYTPPEVRITRTLIAAEGQTDGSTTCYTGSIKVSAHDDVTISLRSCDRGSVQSVTSTNQRGGTVVIATNGGVAVSGSVNNSVIVTNQSGGIVAGSINGSITVTNSPGAVTGSTVNIDRIDMHGNNMIVTGVSGGVVITGVEEAAVRTCLARARGARTSRDQVYRSCLRAELKSFTIN